MNKHTRQQNERCVNLQEEVPAHLHYIVRQLAENRWMLDRILRKLYRTSAGQHTIDEIASQVEENKQKLEGIGQ